jgi:hypothetical protein
MAITKTDIYNLAVSLIGDTRLQLSGSDTVDTVNNSNTRLFNLHYDQTLEELTRLHTWNCSKKRDELTTSDYTEHGWDKQATIPADAIRLIALTNTDSFYRWLRPQVEWVIEGDLILSNDADNYLLYQKIPELADMDSLFVRALYTLIASKIIVGIGSKATSRQELLIEFEQVIMPEARRVNGFEGYEAPLIDSEWLEATNTPTTGGLTTWQALSVGDIPM